MIDINCGMVIGAIVIVGIIGISVANYTQRKRWHVLFEEKV